METQVDKPLAGDQIEISPIAKIAIGYIETFEDQTLDTIVKLSTKLGNLGITDQLETIVAAIRDKKALAESDVCALAFLILLAQNIEPEDAPPVN
ncbi:MAG: hypothetical protein DRP64_19850 [Verrucomicrobia bacterium]|nr:MAG: hypothetical protein DRP64_19850 [Verrucomicrobiota bacterium]